MEGLIRSRFKILIMVPGQLSLSLNVNKTKELIVDFRKNLLNRSL